MDFSRAAREVKCLVSCSTQTWLANFFSALLGNPLWPSAIRHGPLRSQNNRKNKRPVNAPIWRRCVAWGVTWLLKRKTMLEERKKGFGLGEGCIGWGGGGLVAPWECLATPTTFSRSCRSRWRPVISVLSLSSEGPDNQWALLGEAGANPLTPHPTPPPSADACVCVCTHMGEAHKVKMRVFVFRGVAGGSGPTNGKRESFSAVCIHARLLTVRETSTR